MTVMTFWPTLNSNVIYNVIHNLLIILTSIQSVVIYFRWAEPIVTMTCEDT